MEKMDRNLDNKIEEKLKRLHLGSKKEGEIWEAKVSGLEKTIDAVDRRMK